MSQEDKKRQEKEAFRQERLRHKKWVAAVSSSEDAVLRTSDHTFNAKIADETVAQLKSLRDAKQLWERNGKKLQLNPTAVGEEGHPVVENGEIKKDSAGNPIFDTNAPPVFFEKQFKSKHGGFYAKSNTLNNGHLEIWALTTTTVKDRKKTNDNFDSFSMNAKLRPDSNNIVLFLAFGEPLIGAMEHLKQAFKIAGMPTRKLVQTSKGKAVVGQIRPLKLIGLVGGESDSAAPNAIELGADRVIDTREGMPSNEEMRKMPKSKATQFYRRIILHADDLDRVITAFEKFAEQERKAARFPDMLPPGSGGQAIT